MIGACYLSLEAQNPRVNCWSVIFNIALSKFPLFRTVKR